VTTIVVVDVGVSENMLLVGAAVWAGLNVTQDGVAVGRVYGPVKTGSDRSKLTGTSSGISGRSGRTIFSFRISLRVLRE
jgi:hypothetical protein